ncbi:LysR family transcriptional regulator [Ruegeria sp. HKCCD7318]|uniref:LysR family transcriptional regulator n=1 Tax=Ruegeria sp. HKCCD7318 TaxID=2683014 RepID=UPI001490DC74|nr:LysR family transcriptional regulator [Ruegeria sp. HKCCD7318]
MSFCLIIIESLDVHLRNREVNLLDQLGALCAFEAVCRLESHARAADEMRVTEGAVSMNIKSLEAALGMPLFRKDG